MGIAKKIDRTTSQDMQSGKKHILIVVHDMEIGGIERSLINMLNSFDYDRYAVDLFICCHRGEFMDLIPEQVHVLPEVRAYTFFNKPIVQSIREGHVATSFIRLLAKAAANLKAKRRKFVEGSGYLQMQLVSKYTMLVVPSLKQEYDLAVSFDWPHDIVLKKVKAKRKAAWIHTDYSRLEIDNHLDLAMWNRFPYIASVSDACTEAFVRTYPTLADRVVRIENITSPEWIRKMAEEPEETHVMPDTSFNILSVGRLSYVKGFDMAVQALKMLHDRGLTNIQWFIVGYGGYENELRQRIAEAGLEQSFHLLGKKNNPYPYMKKCDLYVQPSRYEGKAVTVTEAQILAKPVLITNYPTAGSQVKSGADGLICELSVEGIVHGIEQLYYDQALRKQLSEYCSRNEYGNAEELQKLYAMVEQQDEATAELARHQVAADS